MNAIFIGSYLSYGILLLFGGVRGRWLFYAAIFALCAAAWGDCAAFVAGIAAADVAVSFPRLKSIRGLGVALIFSGLAAGVFFPPVWLPRGVQAGALYSAANFAFLLGFALSVSAQRAVGFKWLCGAGKWSFALILIHFPVMMSFSAWAFVALTERGWNFAPAVAASWAASIPVLALAVWLFYKFVELPSEKFAQWAWEKLR